MSKSRLWDILQLSAAGLLRGVLVLWTAVTLVFVAVRVLPGDAISAELLPAGASDAQIEAEKNKQGLNDSLPQQYLHYMGDLLHGNLGYSLRYRDAVSHIVKDRIGPTFALAMAAFAVMLITGTILGVTSTTASPAPLRHFSRGIIALSQSVPIYITAIVAVFIFSLELDLLPSIGSDTPSHLILPAAVLGFHTSGAVTRVLSASLTDAFQQPFMLTARAKGLPPIDLLDHGLRVALLPVLRVLALQTGFLLGGTVIIEGLFVRRGLGSLLFESVLNRDYPMVQALALLAAICYLVANGLARLTQRLIDPRLTNNLADFA
ncbi:MAG: ABC transporter permease [Chloroflexi bacterium]|nr:ABC transporter permease [Chloroflexota bacterium]